MKKVIAFFMLALVLQSFCAVAAFAQENDTSTAVVDGIDANRVHLRSAPSTASDSLGLFYTGTEVLVVNRYDEEWAQIVIGSQKGYMLLRYLRLGVDPVIATNRQPRGVVGVAQEEVPVWYSLDVSGEPDDWINDQAVMSIIGETHDHWYYAKADGQPFYIRSEQVWVTESDAPPDKVASAFYWQVLRNQCPFLEVATGKTIYLSQYDAGITDVGYVIGRFAIADLDRDVAMEVAVQVLVEGYPFSYLLLDERDGQVFGYECPFRGLMELKQDGTASWSNSAGNNGFGWRGMWNGDSAAGSIALCDDSGDETIYVVDGRQTTKEAYDTACWQQRNKLNAVWYDVTEDNRQLLFE